MLLRKPDVRRRALSVKTSFHRGLLFLTGATVAFIGIAYCIDPNLLLSRYDLAVSGVSDDNMYRGAYGGLFIVLGIAIGYGALSTSFRQTATLIALLFMGGFALGRFSSILLVGMPHDQIVGLLLFEVFSALAFTWLLISDRKHRADRVLNPA